MSNQIVRALEHGAQKIGKALAEDAGKAVKDFYRSAGDNLKKVARNTREVDAKHAAELKKILEGGKKDLPREPGRSGRGRPGGEERPLGGGDRRGQAVDGNSGCRTAGDPVDVVSGQMITSATDLTLPGLLPLVLRRAYASGYQGGRLHGPGWASTLDQRVQLNTDVVHYAGEDAQILTYPLPTADRPRVLPEYGARWPLTWDREGGTIRIEDPVTGWVRHFDVAAQTDAGTCPLTAVTYRNGHRISCLYGPDGLPAEVQHSGGYRVAVDTVHTSAGPRIEALRLIDGTHGGLGTQVIAYRYDARGRLTDLVDSTGTPLVYAYDDRDRITSWTDRNGHWYAYAYGEDGRVISGQGPENALATDFAYDLERRVTTVTDSLGHRRQYHYDEHGHVAAAVDPLGHTTRTEYDRYGRLLSYTDALGRASRFTLDGRGDVVRVDRPDGTSLRIAYNAFHQPVTVHTPDGTTWHQAYDARGNRTELTDRSGTTTRFAYDGAGRLASVTNALGGVTHTRCNPAGLLVEATDPSEARTTYQRDAFGRPVTYTDALGNHTRYTWTIEGKPTSRTLPDAATETWSYDNEGNTLSHTDPLGAVTSWEYTYFDLPATRTDPDGTRYTFTHDTELRLTRVTNPQGLTWTYAHDAAGRLASETDFSGHALTYTHDALGQLASRRNSLGQTTTYTYDPLGHLLSKDADGELTRYTYDPAGRLRTAANSAAHLERRYDPVGRLTSESVNGGTTSFTYDTLGRRTSRRTPSGNLSTWTYDAAGIPASLTTAGHLLTFDHDTLGRETTRRLSPEVALHFSWDSVHRLTAQSLTNGTAPAPLLQRAYTYRADGNLTAITDQPHGEPAHTRRFDLDRAGRVTAVHAADWSETYAYDAAGHLTEATWPEHRDSAPLGRHAYDGTVLRSAGRVVYQHDGQGRITGRHETTLSGRTRTWQYTWDAEDRLTAVTTPDGARWRYLYDPLGRRMAKQRLTDNDGDLLVQEWTDFVWDGPALIEQTAHSPRLPGPYTLTWDYRGLHPITQTEHLAADTSQEEVDRRFFAIVTDLVGTPTELIAPDGSTAWQARSTLWGLTLSAKAPATSTPLRFPGQYYDPESRLHYNLHRYYDPAAARYLTPDPLGLSPAPDAYGYVPNPLLACDPLGLIRDARGRYAHDPSAPPQTHNRDSEYPSDYRQSTHDEMVKNWTDEGINQGTANPVDAHNNPIPRDQLTWRDSSGQVVPYDQLTYEHLDPVVSHWNTTGYDTDRPTRNDWYNDPANLEPMTRSQNSSGGARLGQTYRQDTGPNYRCGH